MVTWLFILSSCAEGVAQSGNNRTLPSSVLNRSGRVVAAIVRADDTAFVVALFVATTEAASYNKPENTNDRSLFLLLLSSYTELVNDFWAWRLEETPEFASAIGVHDFDQRLESYTLEAFDHRAEYARQFLTRIDATNVTSLSASRRHHIRVLRDDLITYLRGYKWRYHSSLNPVNVIEGVHKDFHYWIDAMLFDDEQSFKVYTTRLRSLATQINEQEAVVGDIAKLLDGLPRDTSFYKPFNRSLAFVKVSESNREKIRLEGEAVILDQVMPSYRTLRTFIRREYLPRGRRTLGVGSLPQGMDYYRACLTWHLSYDLPPSQLFAIGQHQVDDIRRRMRAVSVDTVTCVAIQRVTYAFLFS
ncbi:hypothetical protein LSAT2_027636 [Lamellibrachia satsuma]|nr:hypothetical protein LSAT2_027636 [Lamellibrachia satsuma]